METTETAVLETPELTVADKRKAALQKARDAKKAKKEAQATAPATTAFKDAFDRKLDHFQYEASPDAMQDWEAENPLNSRVIQKVKKKYPGMRCRFVSSYSMDKRGVGYRGWQLFKDKEHPTGIKVGNDLHLAMMPEEMAQRYNDEMAYRSTRDLVKLQEDMMETSIGQGLSQEEMERMGASKGSVPGMIVGDKPRTRVVLGGKTIRGGGYNRSKRTVSREEFVRRMEKEKIASTRSYSFGSRGR